MNAKTEEIQADPAPPRPTPVKPKEVDKAKRDRHKP